MVRLADQASTKGRRVECAHRAHDASLVILSAEKDGAIVEQLGRDDRFGISYRDLLDQYRRT